MLAEYPEALKRLEAKYSKSRGVVHLKRVWEPPTSNADNKRIGRPGIEEKEFAFLSRQPEMARVVARLPDSRLYDEAVICVNARYGFFLAKGKGQTAFAVKSVDSDPKGELTELHNRALNVYLNSPFTIHGFRVEGFMSGSTFRIVDVSQEPPSGGRLVRISFEYPVPATVKNSRGGYEGWFVVSPDEKWVVREYQFKHINAKFKWTGSVHYEGVSDGYPLLKEFTSMERSDDGTRSETQTYDFREFRFADVPEHEFTLSAFGLPELLDPPGGEKAAIAGKTPEGKASSVGVSRTSNAWVLYVLLGLGSLAAAVALKLASSRLGARLHQQDSPADGS